MLEEALVWPGPMVFPRNLRFLVTLSVSEADRQSMFICFPPRMVKTFPVVRAEQQ